MEKSLSYAINKYKFIAGIDRNSALIYELLNCNSKEKKEIIARALNHLTYEKSTTGYQLSPLHYLLEVKHILNKNFNIKFSDLKNMTFCDIGCGYGYMLNFLLPVFKSVSGIEYAIELYNAGKVLFPHINLINDDARKLNPDYDILYTFNITSNKEEIFTPILKKMKKDQILIEICDWSDYFFKTGNSLNFSKVIRNNRITILQK